MTFRQFAFNNVLRNKRLYAAYFLSSLFTVMVFFTFAMFKFHPVFNSGIKENALYGMNIAGGIIFVFSFFFVLYSMSAFLQSRKKEFGLLMMQGMSSGQIRLMVFMENMLIGFFATISGIALGLVFAKAILLLAENVLIISEQLNFYMPLKAMGLTFAAFMLLFLFISFFVSFVLRTSKLIELIKGDKKEKGEPKTSRVLSLVAVLLLAVGYATSLYAKGAQIPFVMLPVIIVVTIGTYFLFSQLSVYIIRRLKRNKQVFWRKTNMILFSDLSFRMKDNARSFFLVAMISTVAFSAIGSLYGIHSYLTKALDEAHPYTFSYQPYEEKPGNVKKVQLIEKELQQQGIQADKEAVEEHFYPVGKRDALILSASKYNRLAGMLGKKPVDLQGEEALVGRQSIANIMNDSFSDTLMKNGIKLADGRVIKAKQEFDAEAYPNLAAYYVVSDSVYKQLPKPKSVEHMYYWQAENTPHDQLVKAGEALSSKFEPGTFFASDQIKYETEKAYGPILFIGLFIGVVFFVSAGSFLYFRLYSDLDEDKQKFRAIAKMGLAASEMKRVVSRQTAILFFAPLVVALIHGAVALTALSRMFNYNLVQESALVLGSFLVIQVVYFAVVRFLYIRQIQRVIS